MVDSIHDQDKNWLYFFKNHGGNKKMPEWIEVVIRTFAAVIVLFLLTKILGKRQVSQLSLFEYITGITIGSLAAYVSLELGDSWYLGVVALLVWGGVSLGIEYLQLKFKTVRDFTDGKATVLIQKGKVLEDQLKKEKLTADELLELLRKKNVFQVSDVEFAVMEPSGNISVLLKKENRPLTAKDFGLSVGEEDEPKTVIMDGEIVREGLLASGFQRGRLMAELKKFGVELKDVFLGQVDAHGQLHLDLYDDQKSLPDDQKGIPKENQALLLSKLKKCAADLSTLAKSTKDKLAKQQFQQCTAKLNRMIKEVQPYLRNSKKP